MTLYYRNAVINDSLTKQNPLFKFSSATLTISLSLPCGNARQRRGKTTPFHYSQSRSGCAVLFHNFPENIKSGGIKGINNIKPHICVTFSGSKYGLFQFLPGSLLVGFITSLPKKKATGLSR